MSQPRASLIMLVALLPMVTYMGHWHTDRLLDAVLSTGHSHSGHIHGEPQPESAAHDHSQHCHGALASCSELPYTGSATVLLLGTALIGLGLEFYRWRQLRNDAPFLHGTPVKPVAPPPRIAAPSPAFRPFERSHI